MDRRGALWAETIDQLIELGMQELDETPEEEAAEERKEEIHDQIWRDEGLDEARRARLLEYMSLLEVLSLRRLRHIYRQGAKDCVRLLRELGALH